MLFETFEKIWDRQKSLKLSSDQVPSAGKAFQWSSAQGRKFAHTRPQSIKKITAITLKQEQLSISSSGTQVASGSGLCSETWAWMRAIYFHLVFWRIWHFSKTMPKKWNKIKHMGSAFVVCFLSLWDPMFWLCFCMLCVCVCVFVCVRVVKRWEHAR